MVSGAVQRERAVTPTPRLRRTCPNESGSDSHHVSMADALRHNAAMRSASYDSPTEPKG